jgi:hypothetical protein
MRRGRVLGVPAVGAAFGGNLSLAWLPLTVMQEVCRGAVPGDHRIGEQPRELGQVVRLPGPQQQPGRSRSRSSRDCSEEHADLIILAQELKMLLEEDDRPQRRRYGPPESGRSGRRRTRRSVGEQGMSAGRRPQGNVGLDVLNDLAEQAARLATGHTHRGRPAPPFELLAVQFSEPPSDLLEQGHRCIEAEGVVEPSASGGAFPASRQIERLEPDDREDDRGHLRTQVEGIRSADRSMQQRPRSSAPTTRLSGTHRMPTIKSVMVAPWRLIGGSDESGRGAGRQRAAEAG